MNTLFVLVTILVLPYAGELGWVDGDTKTCMYKLPATSRMYYAILPKDQPCPKQVEIHIDDDPKPSDETSQARHTF